MEFIYKEIRYNVTKFGVYILIKVNDNIIAKLIENKKRLHITNITKNDKISGQMIIEICEDYNYHHNKKPISLTDESKIITKNYTISLQTVYILAYGISWYNHLEYYSKNYNEEVIDNKKIINMRMNDFILSINYKCNINSEISVKNYFIKIKDLLKNEKVFTKEIEENVNLINFITQNNILNCTNELHIKKFI